MLILLLAANGRAVRKSSSPQKLAKLVSTDSSENLKSQVDKTFIAALIFSLCCSSFAVSIRVSIMAQRLAAENRMPPLIMSLGRNFFRFLELL